MFPIQPTFVPVDFFLKKLDIYMFSFIACFSKENISTIYYHANTHRKLYILATLL